MKPVPFLLMTALFATQMVLFLSLPLDIHALVHMILATGFYTALILNNSPKKER